MEKDVMQIGPLEQIGERIYALRGKRVMLDSELADLYGVTTKRLNEQVAGMRSVSRRILRSNLQNKKLRT